MSVTHSAPIPFALVARRGAAALAAGGAIGAIQPRAGVALFMLLALLQGTWALASP